jgi:hypothetical protein
VTAPYKGAQKGRQFLIFFDVFIKLISIIGKKCSDETAHICTDDYQKKKDDIQDEFDGESPGSLKLDSEIHDQKRDS